MAGDGRSLGNSQDGQKQGRQNAGASKDVATPLKVSGGGSEQFRTKRADNSVLEYGTEGDESELQEVAEIVHGVYVARAEEKWDIACSYVTKVNVEQLRQLTAQSPQLKDAGCAALLKAFTPSLSPAELREVTSIDAGSFRHKGKQGFLIYYGADQTVYSMPLRKEDGSWKMSALSGAAIG